MLFGLFYIVYERVDACLLRNKIKSSIALMKPKDGDSKKCSHGNPKPTVQADLSFLTILLFICYSQTLNTKASPKHLPVIYIFTIKWRFCSYVFLVKQIFKSWRRWKERVAIFFFLVLKGMHFFEFGLNKPIKAV